MEVGKSDIIVMRVVSASRERVDVNGCNCKVDYPVTLLSANIGCVQEKAALQLL